MGRNNVIRITLMLMYFPAPPYKLSHKKIFRKKQKWSQHNLEVRNSHSILQIENRHHSNCSELMVLVVFDHIMLFLNLVLLCKHRKIILPNHNLKHGPLELKASLLLMSRACPF